jgi:hypothetical protein
MWGLLVEAHSRGAWKEWHGGERHGGGGGFVATRDGSTLRSGASQKQRS